VCRSFILAVLVALSVSTTSARTIHRTCRDGGAPCPSCVPRIPLCDADQKCNGVCTFVVREVCLACVNCPCFSDTVVVPAGQKRVVFRSVTRPRTRFVLRCLPHREDPACPECETDADCPMLILGPPCRHCVEGQCVSDPADPRCIPILLDGGATQ